MSIEPGAIVMRNGRYGYQSRIVRGDYAAKQGFTAAEATKFPCHSEGAKRPWESLCTHLVFEIATTSLQTGLAMTVDVR